MFYDSLLEKAKKEGIEKIVVGAVIINDKNEFLLLRRKSDDFLGGIDELPSGNIEPGEGLKEALIRETKEETNLNVIKVKGYINYFDYLSNSGKKARQYNFNVIVDDYNNIELTEHDSFKWENINDVRNNDKVTDEVKSCLEIFNYNEEVTI
jgi:8-oxo-dGTP diphosphatase